MSCLVYNTSRYQLSPAVLKDVLTRMAEALRGRVDEAYVFGSASLGTFRADSDIDLILVRADDGTVFEQRVLLFRDLFEIYPTLDLLVYTPAELAVKLADADIGFWKSVRASMKRFV